MVCFAKGAPIDFTALEESHVLILGGEIFPEKRFIFWNFVSSSEERLEKAKRDWQDDKFPKVINETERIPLPAGALDSRPKS
jgi:redox-sensitive bicupin YhaK (pirin superfamily)